MLQKSLFIAGLFFAIVITSCQKPFVDSPKSGIQVLAKSILKEKMTQSDFATLDWNRAAVRKLNGKEFLLQIPNATDPEKSLYFSNSKTGPVYDWVKLETKKGADRKISGSLTITDINNQLLNTVIFVDNRVVSSTNKLVTKETNSIDWKQRSASLDGGGDDTELPPVTVTGYIHSYYYDFNSLYWLFNQDANFLPYFDGGGDMPILDANTNYLAIVPYTAYATKDVLSNGKVQITNKNPGAFLLSGLNLKFTYTPGTNQLDETSVVSAPVGGLFMGSWTGPTVTSIVSTSTTISFNFTYNNAYNLVGFPFSKDYTMGILYDISTNQITWNWQ